LLTSDQKTSVGIVCDSAYNGFGVRVLTIVKQQPADKAGIEAGDIIMQMGQQKINALKDYDAVLKNLKRGGKLVIKVKRGVTVQNFTLVNL
jgi:C-terminal processing protease CtpA/Prc